MDSNNWRAAQGQVQMPGQVIGGEAVPAGGMEGGDWRTQLQHDTRENIVNKIVETLKRHLPFSGQEGLQELKKIAVRFEEKIHTAATSQSDYLRRISLKMLTMESKSHNPISNSLRMPGQVIGGEAVPAGGMEGGYLKMLTMETKSHNPMADSLLMPGQVIGGEAVPAGGMEGGDWRTQLQHDTRERIVNKIVETLKRHLPFSGQEGLQELKKIAVRFEEKIYTAATSQSDYLRRISLKLWTMETKSHNPMANSQSNTASNS